MRQAYSILVFALCIWSPAFSQTESHDEEPGWKKVKPKSTKLIYVYPINENAAWLNFKNGGFGLLRMFPVKVIGEKAVEEEGFRFTPAKSAPDGMMSEETFARFYMLNSLVKGIYIPYSEMKSVRLYNGFTIRTKNGKKYHFQCKHPKEVKREIKAHLEKKKSGD